MAMQAEHVAYGPTRKSSMALVSDKVRRYLPTAEENTRNALQFNFMWWADNKVALEERFANWLNTGSWSYDFTALDKNWKSVDFRIASTLGNTRQIIIKE